MILDTGYGEADMQACLVANTREQSDAGRSKNIRNSEFNGLNYKLNLVHDGYWKFDAGYRGDD